MNSLCESGLKTGKQLREEGVNFMRQKIHPYIFFRAPYYSTNIDYSTPETEIISSYGKIEMGQRVFIRVDPDRTFVFSSEIRTYKYPGWYDKMESILAKSKKLLSRYLNTISYNMYLKTTLTPGKKLSYDLFSSMAMVVPFNKRPTEPYDDAPIERNSEILVSIPYLTPDYFVLCTS